MIRARQPVIRVCVKDALRVSDPSQQQLRQNFQRSIRMGGALIIAVNVEDGQVTEAKERKRIGFTFGTELMGG